MARAPVPLRAAVVAICLSSCASPAVRISTSLQRYGVNGPQATCMGSKLQASLTLAQLRQLGRAAGELDGGSVRPLAPADFLRAAARIEDLKVPIEVAKAASGCGLLTAPS